MRSSAVKWGGATVIIAAVLATFAEMVVARLGLERILFELYVIAALVGFIGVALLVLAVRTRSDPVPG